MNIIINTKTGQRQIIVDAELFHTMLCHSITRCREAGVSSAMYVEMLQNTEDALNSIEKKSKTV